MRSLNTLSLIGAHVTRGHMPQEIRSATVPTIMYRRKVLPISLKAKGYKDCTSDTFLSLFTLHSLVSSHSTDCQPLIYRSLSNNLI
jgi:hypothetical protein